MIKENTPKAKAKTKKSQKWHWSRLAVQIVALLLFLYLLLATTQQLTAFLPVDLFFRLDPLAGITAMLGSKTWIMPMALGLLTVILAILVGRAWCSWICPMGSILEWVPSRRVKRDNLDIPHKWRLAKYFLLFLILIAALFGSLTLAFLDPITLLFRTITSSILPGLGIVVGGLESMLYSIAPLRGALEWFDGTVRGPLSIGQPFFLSSFFILLFFVVVLALNAIRPRFWCRYLCPLGGLLGLLSRLARVRHTVDQGKCVSCHCCVLVCPTGAIDPEQKFAASAAECITCLECQETCPTQAISFRGQTDVIAPKQSYDPSRRQFLATLGIAVIGAVLLRVAPLIRTKVSRLLRPPGTSEEQLLSQCIRCGECVKVCPTNVIQPGSSGSDWENFWAPALKMRPGYCDYSCNSCGQVCPTGAIPKLSLEQKRTIVLGTAVIDQERCIPWAENRECGVCEEVCPVPSKAITLKAGQGKGSGGGRALRPQVKPDLCIGCGICEAQCPVNGVAAIRVFPQGEASSHSETNA